MRFLVLALLALVGCSSTTSSPPPTEVPVAPMAPASAAPSVSAPAPTASVTAPPKERHPAGIETPEDAPPERTLGTPCTAGSPGCGKNGTLAVVRHLDRMAVRPAPPSCKLAKVSRSTKDAVGSDATFACVHEGQILVQSVCIMCRLPSRQQLDGVIAEMTPEQLAEAQAFAGFGTTPALTTERAWQDAIAKASKP